MTIVEDYSLLLFDYDGTIVSSDHAIIDSVRRTFIHFGETPPESGAVRRMIGFSLGATMRELNPSLSPESIEEWANQYRVEYREHGREQVKLMPGAQETLKRIHEENIHMAVATQKSTASTLESIQTLGLSDYIQHAFGCDAGAPCKPDPAIYPTRIQPCFPKIPKSQILLIGDSVIDLQFANNVGIDSCWASYGYGDPEPCRAMRPKFIVDRMAQLVEE